MFNLHNKVKERRSGCLAAGSKISGLSSYDASLTLRNILDEKSLNFWQSDCMIQED